MINRKINNCPLAILDVLQFLTYFTGQMPASTYASLKTNLIIKMTECQQSVSLPTRILKVPSVAPVIIWGTAIGSWCVTPADAGYKRGSNLHPLQPLGHPQLLQKDHRVNKMKALLCSLVLGLLVASQADAQIDASQVPGAFDRGLCLGGSLGVYPCACPFQGPVVWIAKSSHLSAVQNCSIHWLYTCCLWRLYHLCHLFTGSHACSLLLLNWRNITQLLD